MKRKEQMHKLVKLFKEEWKTLNAFEKVEGVGIMVTLPISIGFAIKTWVAWLQWIPYMSMEESTLLFIVDFWATIALINLGMKLKSVFQELLATEE